MLSVYSTKYCALNLALGLFVQVWTYEVENLRLECLTQTRVFVVGF